MNDKLNSHLFSFGELNQRERAAAIRRCEVAMRNFQESKDLNPFEIAVGVYVNGVLVYHGGETVATTKEIVDRDTVRICAESLVRNHMNHAPWNGAEVEKMKGARI